MYQTSEDQPCPVCGIPHQEPAFLAHPHACTVCGKTHPPRWDFGAPRPPLCCIGCTCGTPQPVGCENCDELGFCMAAAQGNEAECVRELELREQEIAQGLWLVRDEPLPDPAAGDPPT